MLLIDALYINNSGGKVLLDYLVQKLEESKLEVFYLFDIRVKGSYKTIPESRKIYLKASITNRFKFYFNNSKKLKKVLCFASLPPIFKLDAQVFTYFQQVLYLAIPSDYSFYKKLITKTKSIIAKSLRGNTNYWIVQSSSVREDLAPKFQIDINKILIIPFFPPLISKESTIRETNKFLYVSEGHKHKNHLKLLDAFLIFYNKHQIGELHLTVSFSNKYLCDKISELNKSGIPILNHGFLERENLIGLYKSAEFLIFPSLAESFGLGIIEALENGCNIIGADLPYLYSACKPSIVFDPRSINDISKAFEKAILRDFKPSKQLLFNEIDRLLKLLAS